MYDTIPRKPAQAITRRAAILRSYRDKVLPLLLPHLSVSAQTSARTCGDVLVTLEDTHGAQLLEGGIYCKQRMCPACAWRESVHQAQALGACYDAAVQDGWSMLLITLTVPNVPADQLRETLRRMAAAWHTLRKRRDLAVLLAHPVRKTEVTYNRKRNDYHPHYHVMVAVKWGQYSHAYVPRDMLLQAWRDAYNDQSITQVDIRRCVSDGDRVGAVAEVAKYVAKAADYGASADVFDAFYSGLHGVQMMSWGGMWRQLHSAYKAGQLSDSKPDLRPYVWRVMYRWYAGYVEVGRAMRDVEAEQLERDGWREIIAPEWGDLMGGDDDA